uniref:Tc1-like transposase DDE domain-containing protein n=1 Tax=Plectus sambesii TaxID=2011161 RepID=A0A914WKA6_9BILA
MEDGYVDELFETPPLDVNVVDNEEDPAPQTPEVEKKRVAQLCKRDFETMLRMHMQGKSALEIAASLNCSKWCVYKRLTEMLKDGRNCIPDERKRGRKPKPYEEISQKLREIVQDDNSLNVNVIRQRMLAEGFEMTKSTLCRHLNRARITRKRLKRVTIDSTLPRIVEARKNYARALVNVPNSRLIFLDETGINLHTSPYYGCLPRGVEAVIRRPANQGRNVSLLMAISANGVVAHKALRGSYNAVLFEEFLNENVERIKAVHERPIAVMDNARFHHSENVKDFFERNNIECHYLPAYSPELNPIEECFSALKASYRRITPPPASTDAILAQVPQLVERLNADLQLEGFYRHMREFVDKAFNDLPFH